MKILHCITGLGLGGAQVMLYRYLKALGARADEHRILSLMPLEATDLPYAALGVEILDAGIRKGKPTLSGLARIRRAISETSPDLIHGWLYHGNVAASVGIWPRRLKPKVIWSVHHSLHDLAYEASSTRLLIRLSAPFSASVAAIVYCSRASAVQHEQIGFSKAKRAIIPNGIDTDAFRPRPEAKARVAHICGIPADRVIVGNVARSHPMKDQASLVRASASLIDCGHDIQTVIIGPGHSTGAARTAARALGIDDRVTTFETRDDIDEIVPGFDIFALSSAWGEAFPLSVGEAMAAEVPAVVTDVGDCAWLVGDCGVVVERKNPDALVAGILQILELPPEARRALGARGRERVIRNFSIGKFVEEHDALYGSLLAN